MKVKVVIIPPPFETEVDCDSAEDARSIAMERFVDQTRDGEYPINWNQCQIKTIV